MNKRRILSYVLTIGVVLGGSNFAYASDTSEESTKAAVESTVVDSEKTKSISDEEAIDMATKAMKYYLNKDADFFAGTEVSRFNSTKDTEIEFEGKKYMVWSVEAKYMLDKNDIEGAREELKYALNDEPRRIVNIKFTAKVDKGGFNHNDVSIDEDRMEVFYVCAQNTSEVGEFKGEVDTNKLKEATTNFFKKINTEIDESSIFENYHVFKDAGYAVEYLKLTDGREVELMINLKDYSIIGYEKLYLACN